MIQKQTYRTVLCRIAALGRGLLKKLSKGVCGTAAARRQTVRVENVHEFPGHIACDCASNSEIVVPIVVGGAVVGVLDIDSPQFGRFTAEDQAGLEAFAAILAETVFA